MEHRRIFEEKINSGIKKKTFIFSLVILFIIGMGRGGLGVAQAAKSPLSKSSASVSSTDFNNLGVGHIYNPILDRIEFNNVRTARFGDWYLRMNVGGVFEGDVVEVDGFTGIFEEIGGDIHITVNETSGYVGNGSVNYADSTTYPAVENLGRYAKAEQVLSIDEINILNTTDTHNLNLKTSISGGIPYTPLEDELRNISYTSSDASILSVDGSGVLRPNRDLREDSDVIIIVSADGTLTHEKPLDLVIPIRVQLETPIFKTMVYPTVETIYEDGDLLIGGAITVQGVEVIGFSDGVAIDGDWGFRNKLEMAKISKEKAILVFTPKNIGVKTLEYEVEIKTLKTLVLKDATITKIYDKTKDIPATSLKKLELIGIDRNFPFVFIDSIQGSFPSDVVALGSDLKIDNITLAGTHRTKYRISADQVNLKGDITHFPITDHDIIVSDKIVYIKGKKIDKFDFIKSITSLYAGDSTEDTVSALGLGEDKVMVKEQSSWLWNDFDANKNYSGIYDTKLVIKDKSTAGNYLFNGGGGDVTLNSAFVAKATDTYHDTAIDTKKLPAYIYGYPDNTIRPDVNITRSEVAKILYVITDGETKTASRHAYKDVSYRDWAYKYIVSATKNGYMQGHNNLFRGDEYITRAELVVIMVRLGKLEPLNTSIKIYSDLRSNAWFSGDLEIGIENGVIKGYPDGTIGPNAHITRAEVVSVVNRLTHRGKTLSNDKDFPDLPAAHWAYKEMISACNIAGIS